MGQVNVEIGGRSYPLSCRDGDEPHLTELAGEIAEKADGLTQSLGPMSEAQLLLMAALMVADELYDVRNGKMPSWAPPQPASADTAVRQRLAELLQRAERLAKSLDA
ncbi:MAG: cell division protein ZapA [Polymorphobacter sp.]